VAKRSAGLLMFRKREGELQVFLVHPGGPYWVTKSLGAWSIPKGEYSDDELPLDAAQREFTEETGFVAQGPFLHLGEIKQRSGKMVSAWTFEGDCDPAELRSNTCDIEWPPRSGRTLQIVEVDRGQWFTVPEASEYILASQKPLLARLTSLSL
jgi:predicted NUDIX family NTP pyrophosphohydrolase